MLRHGFEQRGLHLGGCAVDLVGQQQVVENGSVLKLERAIFGPEDFGAGDVARQQVGGELNAVKVAFDDLGQLLDRACLCQSRGAFYQQVPAAKQGRHQPLEQGFLTDDALAEPPGRRRDLFLLRCDHCLHGQATFVWGNEPGALF